MENTLFIFTKIIPANLIISSGFLLAFGISYFSIPTIVCVAKMKSLYALPNGRTSHIGAIPTLGGLAIFTGFILSTIIVAGTYFKFELRYIISGLIILFLVGMKDDILVLDPKKKLGAQLLAAMLIAVLAEIRVDDFYGLFDIINISYLLSILITLFVFIVIINAFNLIDGIDGLSSGIGILTASVLGFWFAFTKNTGYSAMSFALAGSLLAFFRYNVFGTQNKIFLGDTGSLIIGLIMAILITQFLHLNLSVSGWLKIESAPAMAFSLLLVPLFDTLRVFTLRIKQGKSPFKADRQHIHHRLLQLGFTHLQSSLLLIFFNLVMIIMCYFLQDLGTIWLTVLLLTISGLLSRFLMITNRKRIVNILNREYAPVEKLIRLRKKQKLLHIVPLNSKQPAKADILVRSCSELRQVF